MRIISGKLKGLILKAVEGMSTRPTSDKIKGSIFNIISNYINGTNVLDLFAGTGNLGIEAISRGAQSVVFVDNDSKSTEIIQENIDKAKVNDACKIYKCDYKLAINKLHQENRTFDIIFIDPPYSKDLGLSAVLELSKNNIAGKDSVIILESDIKDEIPETIGTFKCFDIRYYSRTKVNFFKIVEENII